VGVDAVTRRAVFLDRDGVINRGIIIDGKPYPPRNLEELEVLPGVAEALARLHDASFLLIVATNQPDVARGTQTRAMVEAMHERLAEELPIDAFYACYHDEGDGCDCRKPKPGMLLAAARDHDIDLARSYMVGDRWRDTGCGQNAGCTAVFLDFAYDERQPVPPFLRVHSMAEAADRILGEAGG
jgi:D-glycero-D-manno-heptose 1,7-bisphosphate phosphatase